MQQTFITHAPTETEQVGRAFACELRASGKDTALIALRGGLGVGKTAFTRGFASAFGRMHVKSPTYTIVNEYRTDEATVFHFDMYRIEDEEDLLGIGFDDYLRERAFCLVEWSENVEPWLPRERYTVTIERLGTDSPDARRITIREETV